MDYSLEMIITVAECDALLALAGEDKETLERRRRNLDESIGNFGERTQEYGTEIQSVITRRNIRLAALKRRIYWALIASLP